MQKIIKLFASNFIDEYRLDWDAGLRVKQGPLTKRPCPKEPYLATKNGKNQVDQSGLRFTSRENGSPFMGMGKVGESMSCMKCGLHKPRRLGSQRRFVGGLAFFCHECKPLAIVPKPLVDPSL